MKHVQQLVISLFIIVYISFLLLVFSFKTTDLVKYFLILSGAVVFISTYFLIIKNIKWNIETKNEITEGKKRKIQKRINILKKIVSFSIYTIMCIYLLLGFATDGEFYVKNIYPIFQKIVTNNKIFNWMIRLSFLCYIVALYNIYDAIIKMITKKYDLSEDTKE